MMKAAGKYFVPLEEQLPDDLQPDEPLLPYPGPSPTPRPRARGRSYPEWLRSLGHVHPETQCPAATPGGKSHETG